MNAGRMVFFPVDRIPTRSGCPSLCAALQRRFYGTEKVDFPAGINFYGWPSHSLPTARACATSKPVCDPHRPSSTIWVWAAGFPAKPWLFLSASMRVHPWLIMFSRNVLKMSALPRLAVSSTAAKATATRSIDLLPSFLIIHAAPQGQVWYMLAGRPTVPLCEMQGIAFKYS